MNLLQALFSYIYALLIAILPVTSYTEGVVGQPHSFLPSQVSNLEDKVVTRLIYRGLFKYDIYGTLIPDLAETWSISEDGLVYTIKLKSDQYWSSGKKITADDLIYTSFKVPDLTGVATDKVDDLTVRYILPNKYSPFVSLLTVGVMPTNAEDKMDKLAPVTSGDFMVGRVERNGSVVRKVVLVSRKFNIKKLIFRYYSNEEELVTAAKLGEIDGFTTHDIYDSLPNFTNYRFPLQGIYYALYFNLRNDKVKDLYLRQKLEKVLPIDKIIPDKGIGVEGPVSRSLFTNRQLAFNKYDELFSDNLPTVELTLTIPDTESHAKFAKVIKDIWQDKLKIKVIIKKVPPEEMIGKVIQTHDFEILLYGQEVGRDPDRYVNWHSAQKEYPGLNISGIEHVRADRALEEGRNELSNEIRVKHYNEFQKVINEQTPAIFLYHPYVNYYISKYIKGIGEKYTFVPYDRFLDFFNWKRIETN